MNELELLIDLHKDSNRQGPGSQKETLRALELMTLSTSKELLIADIGCGSGAQTLTIAENINGQIIAVDLFPEFLHVLEKKAKDRNLSEKIITKKESMENLTFSKESLDIIWSEGAIYNIGFEKGVREWFKFLKPNGFLAVSELTWTTNKRPKKIEKFWTLEYPEIDTAFNKIKILENNGYTLVGYFNLKTESWIKNYYRPIENKFTDFLNRNNNSETAIKVIEEHKMEIELYNKYKDFYNYGFYIARKN